MNARLPLTPADQALVFAVSAAIVLLLAALISRVLSTVRLERMAEELDDANEARQRWQDYAEALETLAVERGALARDERCELVRVVAHRSRQRTEGAGR